MRQPSLAIAISLYNRWLELGGLLELLRLNWKSGWDLYISVVTTADEEAWPDWIDKKMADRIEFGSRYVMPQTKSVPGINWLLADRRAVDLKRAVRSRTVDSIIRGCIEGAGSGADCTMHLHACAWPLMESKIYEILSEMKRRKAVVGCRGLGKKLVDVKRPAGDIDDNFFIIDNAFAKRTNFWGFDPALDARRVSNEGRLARRVYELCSENEIYFYDDFSNPGDYVFPPVADQRCVQPYNYYKPLGLLRSHDLSKQAYYCRQLGIAGPIINKIITEELRVPKQFRGLSSELPLEVV